MSLCKVSSLVLRNNLNILHRNAPLLFGGIRECHSTKKEETKNPFWTKLLPTQKMRDNAKKKNLPAVAILNLHGIIAAQVHS